MPVSIMEGVIAWVKANAALVALLGSGSPVVVRVHNKRLPQNPTYRAMVVTLISDNAICHTHDQVVGPYRARIQFDMYGSTEEVEELDTTLKKQLAAHQGAMGTFADVGVFDEGRNPDVDEFLPEPALRRAQNASLQRASRDFLIVYDPT